MRSRVNFFSMTKEKKRNEKKRVFKVLQPLCKMPTHIITFIGAVSQNKRVHKHTEKYAISTMTPCIRRHTYQFNYHLNHTHIFSHIWIAQDHKASKGKKKPPLQIYITLIHPNRMNRIEIIVRFYLSVFNKCVRVRFCMNETEIPQSHVLIAYS